MNISLERLTRRELDVAVLVREGLTDREIAQRLFISKRTAEWHVEQILTKLALRSRSQIAAAVAQAELPRAERFVWPPQPPLFIGRERELGELRMLILRPPVRLVTLTGPPGVGKTRLGSTVAIDLAGEFENGAAFIDLSPISDPALVVSAIGQAVGSSTAFDGLVAALQRRRMLVLLDNFEHVLRAAGDVTGLLAACPGLKIMVTSRECLHLIGWEHEYPVQPLRLPSDGDLMPLQALAAVPAVTLFVERARARNPNFKFSQSTGATVSKICSRLDGLPLGIELAAAASKVLGPDAILARLEQGREMLVEPGADFPSRHHSLQKAISASYELLPNDEQTLFRRLGVFIGGFDHESLEGVCTGRGITPDHAIRMLAHLIDKSLVQQETAGDRYRLLETIREYAVQRLEASSEAKAVHAECSEYFLRLAERAWTMRRGPDEYAWYDRIAPDIDNFRAVGARAMSDGDVLTGLRVGSALSRFFVVRGLWGEGRSLLEAFVDLADRNDRLAEFPAALRELAWLKRRQTGNTAGNAELERYLDIARRESDHEGVALALVEMGNVRLEEGHLNLASHLLHEAVLEAGRSGFKPAIVDALLSLGWLAHLQNDESEATQRIAESLTVARESRDTDGVRVALVRKGQIEFALARYEAAADSWAQALRMFWADGWPSPALLTAFARVALHHGEPSTALRLAGAADAVEDIAQHGVLPMGMRRAVPWAPLLPLDKDLGDELDLAAGGDARQHLDWEAGHSIPPSEAVTLALEIAARRVASTSSQAGLRITAG
jgi:predicted ATPase/DNA-binding CsgD family transcriptional regulator